MRVVILGGTWLAEPPDLASASHLHAERASWPEHRAAIAGFRPDAAVDVAALNGQGADDALRALPDGLRLVALTSVDVYRAAVLRLGAVYGEHDYQHRLEFILRRVRAGRTKIPFGAGTVLFSRVYVGDVATAVAAAVETTVGEGGAFNVVESATPSIRLLAGQILAAAGSDAELVSVPDQVLPADLRSTGAGAQALLADASKARQHLGWHESDPEQALRRTIDWHLRNPLSSSWPRNGVPGLRDRHDSLPLSYA